jgi:hypothetical protein
MAGDDGWNLRLRSASGCAPSADTLFGIELGTYERYLPDDQILAAIPVPVRLLVSADGLPVFAEIAGRLGERLGVDIAATPGRHDAYHAYHYELAEAIRPFLREVSGASR